ncbi:MAG TPA: sigma-70 family RNA polymerase sigma factor [Acidimicrobiales bacterium]|nr:sigma-70 family RNA polymerase sigma factor [Acidimicrobiales bacterium]
MDDQRLLTAQFETNRPHLRAVALRILGNADDVDDALQETWLRLSNSGSAEIVNLAGWLTTVVSRICLNILRTRQRSCAQSFDDLLTSGDRLVERTAPTPEERAVIADSMGVALLIVLEMLSPAERIAFVLHDMFSISFDEISEVLGKSSDACRQLASRARRRVRTAEDPKFEPRRQREVVDAFLSASKSGDFQALLTLLSPDVELIADPTAVDIGAPPRLRGPLDVATRFSGGARAARVALLNGRAGLVWAQGGKAKVAFDFTLVADRITNIDMIGDEDVLGEMRIEFAS